MEVCTARHFITCGPGSLDGPHVSFRVDVRLIRDATTVVDNFLNGLGERLSHAAGDCVMFTREWVPPMGIGVT
jgi:hypothetical protein